jgi:ubiquinone/menaquinone biosynthesis C-methylase UbiE
MNDSVWKSETLAQIYLEGVRGAIPLAKEQLDVMLRVVEAAGVPLRRVLDLGSGDGTLAAVIADAHPDCELTLLDFNETMLEAAEKRFAERAAPVKMVAKDYGEKDWTGMVNGPFDAIVSGYSIHHQPDDRKREIYGELFELLAPGGAFVNVEHVSSPTAWVREMNDEHFIDHLQRWQPDMERQAVAEKYYFRPDKKANILAPVELQCEWLRKIGYQDVDCFLKSFELAVFGGRKPA